jgi:hypothetical protein
MYARKVCVPSSMPFNSADILDRVHTGDRPRAVLPDISCPHKCPPLCYRLGNRILARYHVHSSTRTDSVPYCPSTPHLRFLFVVTSLHVVAYVITPPRLFPCAALPILAHLRPIVLHSSHSMSCPPPPAPRFRYAAMPLSADTSCTATPFRPTFVTSVSISSLALHIRLHPVSCWFPRLPHAVLLDWIRCCSTS